MIGRLYLIAREVAKIVERETGRKDACILATRVLISVLGAEGIDARPLPTRVVAMNETFRRLGDERGWVAGEPYEASLWKARGAWSVVIGGEEDERVFGSTAGGRYNGHLVAVAGDVIIDATIMQASRPERGISLEEPLVAQVPDRAGLHGTKTIPFTYRAAGVGDPVTVLYIPEPGEKAYRTAPDWREAKELCRRAIREVRGTLQGEVS